MKTTSNARWTPTPATGRRGSCSPTGSKNRATRADGYRALAALRRVPVRPNTPSSFIHPGYCTRAAAKDVYGEAALEEAAHAVLPWDWFRALKKELGDTDPLGDRRWAVGRTVRGIEDAAARAFLRLGPKRRAELLAKGA